MLHGLSLIALTLLALTMQCSSDKPGQALPEKSNLQNAEASILQLERQIFAAIKNKDSETLSGILAEDFVYRTPGEREISKPQFLKNIRSISEEIQSVDSADMKVNLYGDVAVLTGVQEARTRDGGGKEGISAQAFSDVFQKREGRWLLVLAYSVEVPASKR